MKLTEALLTAPKNVELVEREIPTLQKDDILVEVVSCGICSSEIPVYLGETQGVRGASFRYNHFPCFLGHEITGVVVDTGPDAHYFRPGDQVTGVAYNGSGFATHVIDSEKLFVRKPAGIPLEIALGEPLMAITNTIRMTQPDFGDFIFIAGDGFMSLLTIACLSHYPLKALVLSGHHDNRLSLAKEFGASHIINAKKSDAYWEVRRLVDGDSHDPQIMRWENGVDIAIEYTGKMAALQLCASLCKPKQHSKLVMASFYGPEPFTLGHYLINRAPCLIPCFPAHSRNVMDDLGRAIWALGQGFFPIRRLITHAFTLEQIELAMETAMSRKNGYIKGIIVPDFSKLESNVPYKMFKEGELF